MYCLEGLLMQSWESLGWRTQIHHCPTCMCAHAQPSHLQEAPCTTCYEDVCVAGWLGTSLLMGGGC